MATKQHRAKASEIKDGDLFWTDEGRYRAHGIRVMGVTGSIRIDVGNGELFLGSNSPVTIAEEA